MPKNKFDVILNKLKQKETLKETLDAGNVTEGFDVVITHGDSIIGEISGNSGNGGDVSILGGNTVSGVGGDLVLVGGVSQTLKGGDSFIAGGVGVNGGDVFIDGGSALVSSELDGDVFIQSLKYPSVDGLDGDVVTTDGFGNLSFSPKTSGGILESVIYTGLYSGGEISINTGDDTTFDIASGIAIIINLDDPQNPLRFELDFPASGAIADDFIGISFTHILLTSGGIIEQQTTIPTFEDRRHKVILGEFLKVGGAIVEIPIAPIPAIGLEKTFEDFLISIGGVKMNGGMITYNNDLTFNVASGTFIEFGRHFFKDRNSPNTAPLGPFNPVSGGDFFKTYTDSSGNAIIDSSNNLIDVDNFVSGTTLTAIPDGFYSIQRFFISSAGGAIITYYGPNIYTNIIAAQSQIKLEPFLEHQNSTDLAFLGWGIFKSGTTSLSAAFLNNEATFITSGPVREGTFNGGGNFLKPSIYLQLSDSLDQKPSISTPVQITFDTFNEGQGIIHSESLRSYDMVIETAGVYTIIAQPQVERTSGGSSQKFHCWMRTGMSEFGSVSSVTTGTSAVIGAPAHGLSTGDFVDIQGTTTTPSITGLQQQIGVIDANSYEINVNVSSVTDGVGDWTRVLDITDDIANSNAELTLASANSADILVLVVNTFLQAGDKVNVMQSISSTINGIGLTAISPTGEASIPSIILSISKIGDF